MQNKLVEGIEEIIKYHSAVQIFLMSHENDEEFIKKVMSDIKELAEQIASQLCLDKEKIESIIYKGLKHDVVAACIDYLTEDITEAISQSGVIKIKEIS